MPNKTKFTNSKLKEILETLFLVLSKKEKHIIDKRYALSSDSKETLQKIGDHYTITRERVRQIENAAVKKLTRNAVNTDITEIAKTAKEIIRDSQGLISEEKLVQNLLIEINPELSRSHLVLALALDSELEKIRNTVRFKPYWKFKKLSPTIVQDIARFYLKILNQNKKIITLPGLITKIKKQFPTKNPPQRLIMEVLEADKMVKITSKGIGLVTWPEINPRTLKDKVNFVLKKSKTPLHFVEISNRIIEERFDSKTVNIQAVHNELIRNQDFVLIGRGIYALRDWGYSDGTVSDVIYNVLRKSRTPLTREKIVQEVLKQRFVKKITILLNLKNKPQFKRVGRDRYAVK